MVSPGGGWASLDIFGNKGVHGGDFGVGGSRKQDNKQYVGSSHPSSSYYLPSLSLSSPTQNIGVVVRERERERVVVDINLPLATFSSSAARQPNSGGFPEAILLVLSVDLSRGARRHLESRRVLPAMVSIRRRKLLGLCAGKAATSVQLSMSSENMTAVESLNQNVKSVSVHPLPSIDSIEQKQEDVSEAYPGSFNVSSFSSLKEEPAAQQFPVPGVKRRKRHRRKHVEDQEPCTMRGVYFKNMKWQAAIKVDKKQIHLGTVGSQEEAAHLYDRAAFMCGREPNFDLPEEEKQELRQFKWGEFLEMTRNAITSKKHQRRLGSGPRRKAGTLSRSDWEPEQDVRATSASDDMDGDGSSL